MKKIILLLTLSSFFFSCNDNGFNNKNPYLPNYTFTVDINMNFYDNLKFTSNGIYYSAEGVRGIIIFNTGSGYKVFDAACPNQALSSCSTMSFKKLDPVDPLKIDKTTVVCSCDGAEYSLFSGQSSEKQYPLKQYRVEVRGNVLRVYN